MVKSLMVRVHTIQDLQALRAMADPLRKQIIRELQREALTTAQVATLLGEKATKLHYHVLELERHGLIELVETRMKGNLQEKYYQSVAEYYRVDPQLFEAGPEALDALCADALALLDRAALDLRSAMSSRQITAEESSHSIASLLQLHLTPHDVKEFGTRLQALIAEYREKSLGEATTEATGGVLLHLLFFPLASLSPSRTLSASDESENTK